MIRTSARCQTEHRILHSAGVRSISCAGSGGLRYASTAGYSLD